MQHIQNINTLKNLLIFLSKYMIKVCNLYRVCILKHCFFKQVELSSKSMYKFYKIRNYL